MEGAWMKKAVAIALTMNVYMAVASGAAGGPFNLPPPSGGGMSFQQCYVGCFILCAIQPGQTLSSCGFQCLRDCLIPQDHTGDTATSKAVVTPYHFCNLGCASAHCTAISTLNNPGRTTWQRQQLLN
ncbi:hypothetical protein V2J09_023459 [Rumex salicifolius]